MNNKKRLTPEISTWNDLLKIIQESRGFKEKVTKNKEKKKDKN